MSGASALGRLVLGSAGLVVWSSCFLVLYVVLSIGCEAGTGARDRWDVGDLNLVLTALWVLHLLIVGAGSAALARAIRRHRRGEVGGFVLRLAFVLWLSGGVATLWTGFPAMILPPCV